ncbi:major facilitator superfamily domain-containing protein 6-like [Rhopilema esculentum]|uniref:major facilitator superfamily domain-containing protein 6-like n=1 Tax=Rhopilema esculentum TaxID=499914 RepID=UPI0031E2511A
MAMENVLNATEGSGTSCKPSSQKVHEKSAHCSDDAVASSRCTIDPVLLRLRIFFFLFYAGFGTTFPYLGIYFKQIGLSAGSVGVLAGVRPLIQCVGGPLWAMLADRYNARKAVLLFSIMAWLVMTVLLAFPRPRYEVCKIVNTTETRIFNKTLVQKKDTVPSIGFHDHMSEFLPFPHCFPSCADNPLHRSERSSDEIPGRSSLKDNKEIVVHNFFVQNFFNNTKPYNDYLPGTKRASNKTQKSSSKLEHKEKPHANAVKYVIEWNQKEMHDIFVILLILIVVGEFLEAPSFIMVDTALLEYLGKERSRYGRTRLFGSIGYGVASLGIGAVLDRVHYQYCGKTMIDYTVLFYVFAGFMVVGFFFAMFGVKFSYTKKADCDNQSKAVAMSVLKLFCTLRHGSFLLIAWFMGFSHGGVMNFLNWYLEDLGASRFMMGIGTTCRSTAIIIGLMISNFAIDRLGHYNMILFALVAYTLSFFGYSVITNPWYALPIEVAQGICYSMSWSACITYLGAAAPPKTEATVQGVLQGVYWGLGTGLGAFAGGAMINKFGAVKMFRIAGVVTAIVVLIFLIINLAVNKVNNIDGSLDHGRDATGNAFWSRDIYSDDELLLNENQDDEDHRRI